MSARIAYGTWMEKRLAERPDKVAINHENCLEKFPFLSEWMSSWASSITDKETEFEEKEKKNNEGKDDGHADVDGGSDYGMAS